MSGAPGKSLAEVAVGAFAEQESHRIAIAAKGRAARAALKMLDWFAAHSLRHGNPRAAQKLLRAAETERGGHARKVLDGHIVRNWKSLSGQLQDFRLAHEKRKSKLVSAHVKNKILQDLARDAGLARHPAIAAEIFANVIRGDSEAVGLFVPKAREYRGAVPLSVIKKALHTRLRRT